MAVGGGRQYKPPNVALFFWLQGAIDIRSVSPNPFSPASRLWACHDGAGRASGAAFARVDAWSSPRMGKFWRFCFGVYGFALQNPKQFAGFLERFIGDWLPPFEQALGAAGFPPERARSLATLSLAANARAATGRYRRARPHRRGIPGNIGTVNAGVPRC